MICFVAKIKNLSILALHSMCDDIHNFSNSNNIPKIPKHEKIGQTTSKVSIFLPCPRLEFPFISFTSHCFWFARADSYAM